MSTYLDYVGRTVDVLAFRGQKAEGETLLDMALVDEASGGEICTGAQMVAQAWLLEFMKEGGSVPYSPDEGCPFMTAARQGRLLTETDVYQQFNLSAAPIRRNLVNAEATTDPADERFAEARLTGVTVFPGIVQLAVTVVTRAGSARKVILPLSLTV